LKTPIVERLSKRHIKTDFDCGKPALTNFLRNLASQHEKRGLGRTYVSIYEDDPLVMGYYALAASKVAFENWPEALRMPPGMGIPTILLGRLAVDQRFQGQGLGGFLLHHAMWLAERIASDVGAVALEVDALDEEASRFYERYQFDLLRDNPKHFFRMIDTIRKLNLDFASVTRIQTP